MALAQVEAVGVWTGGSNALMPQKWCIITCEYPPLVGGVSDHTYLLARSLANAGDTVDVWTPPIAGSPPESPGVTVHVLPSLFRADSLRVLQRVIREQTEDTRILVQYVPTGFGWRMMNLPFAILLYANRTRGLDIYFHEVGFPITRTDRLRRNAAGVVHVVMNWFAVRAASRAFVAIPEWARRLEGLSSRRDHASRLVTWVPVPSNVPDSASANRVAAIRESLTQHASKCVIGHFGTFGRYHTNVLLPTFARILNDSADRVVLFVGRNSGVFRDAFVAKHPELASRVVATGGLEASEVSNHLAACDLLVQPYEDGASARRGSLMAGLALGVPILTNIGEVTGSIWINRPIVQLAYSDKPEVLSAAVTDLLANPAHLAELGKHGKAAHAELFALEHGVATLRGAIQLDAAARVRSRATLLRMPPSVLMLHTTLPTAGRKPGGVEVAVHRLANALVDLGAPVTVASMSHAPADARYTHRILFPGASWLRDTRLGRLVVLPILLNSLRLRDADVVHYHGDDWFIFRRPRPTVRTLHGSALREAQRATRWQRKVIQYMVYPFERLAARMATIAVGVGKDAAALHGVERIIGNGVDPSLFSRGTKSSMPQLLYVGTWEGRKRGKWMYEIFVQSIAPRNPDVELRFIADVEPPPHPRVRFERFPDDATLAQAYKEAWVFALPSTYEGFGIPYLEAMSSGTAVVATPNEGARSLLGEGRYGLLVDDTQFADAVLDLLNDDAERDRLAAAGSERARGFTWPDVARAYLQVYDDARAKHSGLTQ